MKKADLFRKAHAMTKRVIKPGDSYQATFGQCLRTIKAAMERFWALFEGVVRTTEQLYDAMVGAAGGVKDALKRKLLAYQQIMGQMAHKARYLDYHRYLTILPF